MNQEHFIEEIKEEVLKDSGSRITQDGVDHKFCTKCGLCLDCLDCKCFLPTEEDCTISVSGKRASGMSECGININRKVSE